jgi:drug/metabolite transporter (DMT)-like permease
MNGIPWILAAVLVALGLLGVVMVVVRRKRRQSTRVMDRKNRFMLQFAVGLALAITAALMMYCQERCFLRVDMESWPAVLGIFGIGIIGSSGLWLFQYEKK